MPLLLEISLSKVCIETRSEQPRIVAWISLPMSYMQVNPIIPGLFLNSIYPGGGKFAPPYKMPNNGREVPKLSWNLISYRDWCQTKGFTTFRHLEPPQLMVWKVTFFWWFMRFVRVPLMKVGQIGPTFLVPEKTVNFFRVKPAVSSFTLKMRKSHKKLARVYAYTHAYTQIRDGGGKYAPPR